jgi:hypothetical protein
MGPVVLALVAPAMYSDRVALDSEHFEARYGIWFSPQQHNVRFDDLSEIRFVETRDAKNRVNHELHCVYKSGHVTVVHVGDLTVKAVPEILERARAKGVPVLGSPF